MVSGVLSSGHSGATHQRVRRHHSSQRRAHNSHSTFQGKAARGFATPGRGVESGFQRTSQHAHAHDRPPGCQRSRPGRSHTDVFLYFDRPQRSKGDSDHRLGRALERETSHRAAHGDADVRPVDALDKRHVQPCRLVRGSDEPGWRGRTCVGRKTRLRVAFVPRRDFFPNCGTIARLPSMIFMKGQCLRSSLAIRQWRQGDAVSSPGAT